MIGNEAGELFFCFVLEEGNLVFLIYDLIVNIFVHKALLINKWVGKYWYLYIMKTLVIGFKYGTLINSFAYQNLIKTITMNE